MPVERPAGNLGKYLAVKKSDKSVKFAELQSYFTQSYSILWKGCGRVEQKREKNS